ncbi:MAG: type I-F CRISPR-associated protein Csy2 [Rhodocyclaceae bacterium]|nr:type I-F CRISPR-associated protein Csy2 [Rhodocyclaceae bacterium]
MSYLVIPRIRLQNANAQPAWWMIAPPPMTAYAGFSHALALALGWSKCQGFGVVHHDIQFLGEFEGERGLFLPHQFRAASFIDKDDYSSKNQYALSSQPTARCHLNVSLVIKKDEDDAVDFESAFPRFMRGARLAGGTVVDHGKASLQDSMEAVIKYLKTGHAIHERQDLMVMQEGERDMLDVVLRLTDPQLRFEAANKAKSASREKPDDADEDLHSWLMPTALGYLAISEFQNRKNVRGGLPHAFAEPLVGMVQYQTLRRAGIPIWRATNPNTQTFLVTTSN